jgi:putative ABC transport system substrate-binding protein
MKRRNLMWVLAGAVAYPILAGAQQKAKPVVGFLNTGSPDPSAPFVAAFLQGLRETGYVEGQNVAIEYRWAEAHYDRLPGLAADLVRSNVDVIVTIAGAPALAAKNATSTIPIVFAGVGDPVGFGLVASLPRPNGNLTGFSNINVELTPKRFELLSELVPHAKIVALLVNPNNVNTESIIGDMQEAARAKGLRLAILKAGTESEIDDAFATLVELHAGALLVAGDPFFFGRREQLLALASTEPTPAVLPWQRHPPHGGPRVPSWGAFGRRPSERARIAVTGRHPKPYTFADFPRRQRQCLPLPRSGRRHRALVLRLWFGPTQGCRSASS